MRIAAVLLCTLLVVSVCGAARGQEKPAAPADVGSSAPAPAAEKPAAEAPEKPAGPSAAELQKKLDEATSKLDAAASKLDQATRRIGELETKVDSLNAQVTGSKQEVGSLSTQMKALEAKAKVAEEKKPAGLQFKPYGYIKLDIVRDSKRTSGTDATGFVLQQKSGFENDGAFSMTLRQTRLGLDIIGPNMGEATQMGKVEIDFYAPATVENKAQPMLRQAYYLLSYPTWNVLAGQTWEVVSPLYPFTVNYLYLALSGNPGYRKPMLRYERVDKVWGDKILQTDVAMVRGVGGEQLVSTASLDDEATHAGWPVFEARAGISCPTKFKNRPVTVGLSGHIGQEEFDPMSGGKQIAGDGMEFMTYMGNLDWTVPVAAKLEVKGEFFIGRNLDAYMGGIGQGVNLTTGVPIDDVGGWTQLCYRPNPKWLLSVGGGIDNPDDEDLSAGSRSFNETFFTNGVYNLNERTQLGLELSWMNTNYTAGPDGENFRVQAMVQYNI